VYLIQTKFMVIYRSAHAGVDVTWIGVGNMPNFGTFLYRGDYTPTYNNDGVAGVGGRWFILIQNNVVFRSASRIDIVCHFRTHFIQVDSIFCRQRRNNVW
jgi:hypothetical protein